MFWGQNEDYCEMTLKLGQGHQRSNFCLTIRVVPFLSHNIADTLFTCIDYIKHNIKFKMNKNVHFYPVLLGIKTAKTWLLRRPIET